MSIKKERIASNIQRELSIILSREVKDEDINFVTVTAVHLANDLSFAKVYYTVLNQNKITETNEALKSASGFIRKELASRIDVRHVPELQFIYDESIDYGKKIEDIIGKINKNKNE